MACHTSQQECLLLKLPAEIRNAIYSYILVQPSALPEARSPTQLPPSTLPSVARRRFCANILLSCKQVNKEASPIFYGQNIFFAHASLLNTFPAMILTPCPDPHKTRPVLHPRPLSLIRRFYIRIRLDTDPRFDRKKVQESFSNVEELEVDVFQAMYGGCDFTVLKLFEDVRGVGKAVISGSIGNGQYATWLAQTMMRPVGSNPLPCESTAAASQHWDSWTNGNR